MPLSSPPHPDRYATTLVTLALALLLGTGLASTLTREAKPVVQAQVPPARSRLVAVLEGVMAVNITPAERERFKAWVASGATREGFVQVEAIVANNCASCHDRGGQYPRLAGFEDIQPIALEAAPTGLAGLIDPRGLHLLAFPLLFLVAVAGYLRRTGWPRWKPLAVASGVAVAFDAGQWWVRQGRPEHLWAAWTAAAALALAMATVVGVILKNLWGSRVPR
jgi:cytochrome c553